MEVDRWEMEKNTVKSDFKNNLPFDGKNQIKNGGEKLKLGVGGCRVVEWDDLGGLLD